MRTHFWEDVNEVKIAIGVRHFRSVGGAENFIQHLAAYLSRRGHQVTVYAISGKPMKGVNLVLLQRPRLCVRFHRDWSTGRLLSNALYLSNAILRKHDTVNSG